jgi:hypothetical protein
MTDRPVGHSIDPYIHGINCIWPPLPHHFHHRHETPPTAVVSGLRLGAGRVHPLEGATGLRFATAPFYTPSRCLTIREVMARQWGPKVACNQMPVMERIHLATATTKSLKVCVVVVVSSRRLHLADILLSCVGCFASFKDLAQLPRPFLNAPVPVFTAGDILSPLLKSDWPPRSCCRHKKIMRPCDPGGLPRQNMNYKESGVWRSSRSAARSCVVAGRKPFERPP